MGFFNSLFCKHDWDKISESVLDTDRSAGWDTYVHWERAKVVLVKCKKCGTLKRIIL